MSAAACARTASDLTTLVHQLGRARGALARQSRLPEEAFGGLSGDAYRRHVAQSAAIVAGAASDLALLAGALAALGRALAAAEELRDDAAGSPPDRARELRARAHDVEHDGQQRWRDAVATYEGRVSPGQRPGRQRHVPAVAPGTARGPTTGPATDSGTPTAGAPATPAPAPVASAGPPPPAPAITVAPEPALDSALVIPQTGLESELVLPPTEPSRCGTQEVVDELR